MLEYFLSLVLIIASLWYITRFKFLKTTSTNSDNQRIFGKWTPVAFQTPPPPPYPQWSVETTRPLPYRPFKYGPEYFTTMGIARLDWNDWIELDNQWTRFHQEKLSRLSNERASLRCQTTPEAFDASLETMELIAEYLIHRYPSLFEYQQCEKNEKQIRIKKTGEIYPIKSSDPLKYASLLIEDDLAIMIEGSDGQYYFKAGSILLPGFWRLEDKLNMSLAQIHISGYVPQYKEKLEQSMDRYFRKISPQQLTVRFNYGIQTDAELAWSSSIGPEETYGILQPPQNYANLGIEDLHFRSERQTLRRLPRTGAILFTIRTYFVPILEIGEEAGIPGRLASAIRSWPDDIARHRGKKKYEDVLLKYLDEKHRQQCDDGLGGDYSKSYPY